MHTAGFLDLTDDEIGRHFGHHAQFCTRHPGRSWRFRRLVVPIGRLRCLYSDPGCGVDPDGLMGSIGMPPRGYAGALISDLADAIMEALDQGRANTANPALKKLLAFRDGGRQFIYSRQEPIALSLMNGEPFVREGTHRGIALAMLREDHIDALDFESAVLL